MTKHNYSGYVRGCRCDICRQGHRDYSARYAKTDSGRRAGKRASQRNNRFKVLAAAWITANHPEIAAGLRKQVDDELENNAG